MSRHTNQSAATIVSVFPFKDLRDMLRCYFAQEEGLSNEEAERFYSDSILQAAEAADPVLYAEWEKQALCSL